MSVQTQIPRKANPALSQKPDKPHFHAEFSGFSDPEIDFPQKAS